MASLVENTIVHIMDILFSSNSFFAWGKESRFTEIPQGISEEARQREVQLRAQMRFPSLSWEGAPGIMDFLLMALRGVSSFPVFFGFGTMR